MNYLLGIDGGGSKTRAVLTDVFGRVLSDILDGPANPNDVGITESAGVICDCIDRACKSAGVRCDENVYAFAGVSGATNNKDMLHSEIGKKFPKINLRVDSDAVNMISCELPGDGACVICGTGNACFVRKDMKMTRIGGWGYLIDRGGDGYSIGRDVLDAALRAYDGRGGRTVLTEYVAEKSGKPVELMISEIYTGGKPYIASFAPLAMKAYRAGDEVASEIIGRNAVFVAELMQTALNIAGDEISFVMGGSINQHFSPEWQELISKHLGKHPRMIIPEMPPVFGALVEALRTADIQYTHKFRELFTETEK